MLPFTGSNLYSDLRDSNEETWKRLRCDFLRLVSKYYDRECCTDINVIKHLITIIEHV